MVLQFNRLLVRALFARYFLIVLCLFVQAPGYARGLCQRQVEPNGRVKLLCSAPLCPPSRDCKPPTLDKVAVKWEVSDHLALKWISQCAPLFPAGCWEGSALMQTDLEAMDDSGINAVRLEGTWSSSKKTQPFICVGKAQSKEGVNAISSQCKTTFRSASAEGTRAEIQKACVIDKSGNEACTALSDSK